MARTTDRAGRPAGLPLSMIVLSAVAVGLLGAGVIGLTRPELAPRLARPAVAWSLIAVGAVLDIYATAMIVVSARRRQRCRR